ncbi:MAG: ferritin family protein [Chloroflexi bacterium]|nr:ferritin family protein [Chloroflexota bacterium]
MSNNTIPEALKKGMTTEIWGLNFYRQALERTNDESGKAIFASLVSEEEAHLAYLIGEYAAVAGDKGKIITREDAIELAKSVPPTEIFPEASQADQLIAKNATDLQVLEMAMQFELKGFKFYEVEAAIADTPEAKSVWTFLAAAEDRHYTFLQKTHEFLATKGTWYFDNEEKPFFEG